MQSSITVGIPEELSDKLRDLATKRNLSRNAIMREGLELVIEKYKD
jgi:predicted transcriptional regulator